MDFYMHQNEKEKILIISTIYINKKMHIYLGKKEKNKKGNEKKEKTKNKLHIQQLDAYSTVDRENCIIFSTSKMQIQQMIFVATV